MRTQRFKNQPVNPKIYCKYYLLLERIYKYYTEYEHLYLTKLLSIKDDKIDKLKETVDKQSAKIDELLNHTTDIKTQNEDLKTEVVKANIKLDETKKQNEQIKEEFVKVNEKLTNIEHCLKYSYEVIDRKQTNISTTNTTVLYRATFNDDSVKYYISVRQIKGIVDGYKNIKKKSNIKSVDMVNIFNPSGNGKIIDKISKSLKSSSKFSYNNKTNEVTLIDSTEQELIELIDQAIVELQYNVFNQLEIEVGNNHRFMDAFSAIIKHVINRSFELFIKQDKKYTSKLINDVYLEYKKTHPSV